jgi:2-amino-4-hydroxy-6-hydroxymethyldihydropteridine diphosphokinase
LKQGLAVADRYLIALGSNQRHSRHGAPEQVLRAAFAELERAGLRLLAVAPVMRSDPLGPSNRRYANSAVLAETRLDPEELLDLLKGIEHQFGRRTGGQRWISRVLDLDLILWSGGAWASPSLTIPHAEFRDRAFVLTPAKAIAPAWRDPISRLSLRQLHSRLTRPRPIPR